MRVGFIGLGRLGLPIAAVLSQHHQVTGYDPDPSTAERLKVGHPWETGLGEFLNDRIALASSIDAATWDADVIVVCVQTPHGDELDGTTATSRREPFDLSYVEAALAEVSSDAPVVLMSTVLPGDCRNLAPLIAGELIYAPAFPAMGTTVNDLMDPEFILVGQEIPAMTYWEQVSGVVGDLWEPVFQSRHNVNIEVVTWETAELAKMLYNTFIGAKIALANTAAWLGEEVGADGGEVMRILADATRRITSPAYLEPGLGDGGACHPRDQIALSWLAREHGVYDIFSAFIDQRLAHSEWIASVVRAEAGDLDIVILGSAYKADSTLTDGSPAILLANQTDWPIVERPPTEPACVVIGVAHSRYQSMDLSQHVVIDPFGIIPGAIHPGRSPSEHDRR